jgi:ribonuclease P protein component
MKVLTKKQKIKSRKDILFLLKTSNKVSLTSFNIFYKTNDFNNDRLAVLVSRKIGNAVKRNKIKRITREVFRKEIKRNPPFIDILIQIRPGIKIYNKNEYEICLREWIKESKTN